MEQEKINYIFVYLSQKIEQKVSEDHYLSGQLKVLYYIVKRLNFFEASRLGSTTEIAKKTGLNRKTVKPILENMIIDKLIINVNEEVFEAGNPLHRMRNEYILNEAYGYNSNILIEKYFMDKRESIPNYHLLKGYYEGMHSDRSSFLIITNKSKENVQVESEWYKITRNMYETVFNEMVEHLVSTFKSLFVNVDDLRVDCVKYIVEKAIIDDCNLRRKSFKLPGQMYIYKNNNEFDEILKRNVKNQTQVLNDEIRRALGFDVFDNENKRQ